MVNIIPSLETLHWQWKVAQEKELKKNQILFTGGAKSHLQEQFQNVSNM